MNDYESDNECNCFICFHIFFGYVLYYSQRIFISHTTYKFAGSSLERKKPRIKSVFAHQLTHKWRLKVAEIRFTDAINQSRSVNRSHWTAFVQTDRYVSVCFVWNLSPLKNRLSHIFSLICVRICLFGMFGHRHRCVEDEHKQSNSTRWPIKNMCSVTQPVNIYHTLRIDVEWFFLPIKRDGRIFPSLFLRTKNPFNVRFVHAA